MAVIQKIPKEDILRAIETIGPAQPIDIRRELKGGDTFLIGAMLSEFVASGELVISKTRRGGSPFYYNPNKPETLEKITQYLNEKDRRTCLLLKEQKVMREDAQEPLVRVGLQNIYDFSKKFVVTEDGKEVVYWRYFLVPEDEALRIIKSKRIDTAEKEESKQEAVKEKPAKAIEEKTQPEKPKKVEEKAEEPKRSAEGAETSGEKPKKEPKKRAPRKTAPVQATLQDWTVHDTLWEKVQKFAQNEKSVAVNPQSIKMHAELSCVLKTDGPYGKLALFAYALNKKKIAEKDITNALLLARGQGMPLLVLYTEEMPAKLLKSFEDKSNVYFRKI
jgi:hypothetical protein